MERITYSSPVDPKRGRRKNSRASNYVARGSGSSECKDRRYLVRELKKIHAVAVESNVNRGTPDINYSHGWIELKRIKTYPVHADTVVRIKHFTGAQRDWLSQRVRAGGRAYVLLHIASDWFLFDGLDASTVLGSICQRELHFYSIWSSMGKFDKESFIQVVLPQP